MHSYRVRPWSLLVLLLALTPTAARPDGLTDAKRRAAADLMKDGKAADAVALLEEVLRSDPGHYKDHLALARAYDKVNRAAEASESYRRAADLLAAARADDRPAKAEIDRRLKVLDAQFNKIAPVEDEFLRKLDALERDAVAARDMRALQRVFALRGGVWNARGRKDGAGLEVPVSSEWVDSGIVAQQGKRYRIRAAGIWTFDGHRLTADGDPDRTTNFGVPYGGLTAHVDNTGRHLPAGTDSIVTAPATGRLLFISSANTRAERERSTGSLYVLVTPLPD